MLNLFGSNANQIASQGFARRGTRCVTLRELARDLRERILVLFRATSQSISDVECATARTAKDRDGFWLVPVSSHCF
jgi:hypothetical protein